VKIILPGTTVSGLVLHAGRSRCTGVLRGGVKIHEQKDAVLHAKTAVIDGVRSTVGSTHLDWRSFVHANGINAVIPGHGSGAPMEAMFDADLDRPYRITLERWRQLALATRTKETGARMWEYWPWTPEFPTRLK
jgi:cardiolipin synthase